MWARIMVLGRRVEIGEETVIFVLFFFLSSRWGSWELDILVFFCYLCAQISHQQENVTVLAKKCMFI